MLNPNLYSAVCMGCVYILSDDHDTVSCFNPKKYSWQSEETAEHRSNL